MCELGDIFRTIGLPPFSHEVEEGEPPVPGSFTSPRTGSLVVVVPKRGESPAHAMTRVMGKHRA